jgi:hypothetical protein
VTPAGAAIQVLGHAARVTNGVFAKTVGLTPGQNAIDVVASESGYAPSTTTITVTRGRTVAQLQAAAAQNRARQASQAAARAQRNAQARARASAPVSVPSVVGERLDVAESDLQSAGLNFKELGGGAFGIVVKANWKVCQSRPSPGSSIPQHGSVTLIVDRPENC